MCCSAVTLTFGAKAKVGIKGQQFAGMDYTRERMRTYVNSCNSTVPLPLLV